jgi:protein CpxP
MIRRFHILTLSAFVALAALGCGGLRNTVVAAQGPGPGIGMVPGGGPRAGLALRALDLTEAQREQVRQFTEQHRQQTRALVERAHAARDAQRQAMEAPSFSEQQVRATAQALAEVLTDLAVQQARLRSDVYALLTSQQQQRLQQMQAERETRQNERLERMQQRRQEQQSP